MRLLAEALETPRSLAREVMIRASAQKHRHSVRAEPRCWGRAESSPPDRIQGPLLGEGAGTARSHHSHRAVKCPDESMTRGIKFMI